MSSAKVLLGARIKQIRRAKGLSQGELSERIEITENYLSRIEVGTSCPSLPTLEKVAAALDVSLKDLFDFEPFREETREVETLLKSAGTEKKRLVLSIAKLILRGE
ncbi:helix-turn-helix domain-containing protein [Geomonas ferrireducens]|uniref:helix-turn-helix domain-containing protein n=1 Tax=Geomonas ferrireducens TaxID=2570227 RepID=UPI0013A5C082|nr:helix-turn-helix transcriptional regulator [Geomonas ferrireducens]